MTVSIHHASCLDWLAEYDGPLFDSCVTDPPYEIGFMGKKWDNTGVAFQPETWRAIYDVLKPGAHLVAFSGTRTYHRMACAIEDAGFEIRDQLAYCYGSGFPKSHNINKALGKQGACCECENPVYGSHEVCPENLHDLQCGVATENALSGDPQQDLRQGLRGETDLAGQDGQAGEAAQARCDQGSAGAAPGLQHDLRPLPSSDVSQAFNAEDERGQVLQSRLQEQGASNARRTQSACDDWGSEPGLEGRCDAQEAEGELQGRPLCASAGVGEADGAQGRLHHGTSASDGSDVRLPADANGSGQSHRSQPGEQSSEQPRIVSDQRGSQARGSWPICAGCGKPRVPEGLGSALKPAWEPVCLARKPLSEKNIAANVLTHGTGAINVDGCRVVHNEECKPLKAQDASLRGGRIIRQAIRAKDTTDLKPNGRFPANILHDGSDEVLAGFPETGAAKSSERGLQHSGRHGGLADIGGNIKEGTNSERGHDDNGGSAARFFYSAKAGPLDRIGTAHATVKPVDLMRWLVRMVTPPAGRILEPFAGSGKTGIAAMAEGFDCTMIDIEAEHVADIERQLAFLRGDGAHSFKEHNHAKLQRVKETPLGGLFGEAA